MSAGSFDHSWLVLLQGRREGYLFLRRWRDCPNVLNHFAVDSSSFLDRSGKDKSASSQPNVFRCIHKFTDLTLVRHYSQGICAECKCENHESQARQSSAGIAFCQYAGSGGQQNYAANVAPKQAPWHPGRHDFGHPGPCRKCKDPARSMGAARSNSPNRPIGFAIFA
jgi:hypothetical protein